MRRTLVSLAVLASLTGLAGCGTPAVAQSEVETKIADTYTDQVGEEPDSVTCPDDLTAEVDATIICALAAGGEEVDLLVTVTSVDGDDVKFDYEPAP